MRLSFIRQVKYFTCLELASELFSLIIFLNNAIQSTLQFLSLNRKLSVSPNAGIS